MLQLTPTATHAECKIDRIVELPVTMDGWRPMIAAKINGQPAQFFADSGAWYSLIPTSVAKAASLPLHNLPGFYVTGLGGRSDAKLATVKEFTLANVPIHNVDFVVLSTQLESSGVLGQNVWGIGDVEYDLPDGAIRLFKSEGCQKVDMGYWSKEGSYLVPLDPRDKHQGHTYATVTIDGARVGAIFDTGAPTSILSLKAAARAGVKPGDPGVEPAGPGSGFGRKLFDTWIAKFKLIQIGGEELHNVKLRIGDFPVDDEDMLIGMDFFISHRVYVGNTMNRMFITYTGGRIFDTKARREGETQIAAATQDTTQAPKDAEGFSRRGAVLEHQKDLAGAIADFTRAIELAPKEPRYFVQRAEAYLAQQDIDRASADLDHALALDPAHVDALLDRAVLRLRKDNKKDALADIDVAARTVAGPADARYTIANLYAAAGAEERAIREIDLWLAAHRDDSQYAVALNNRCWFRALAGKDLDQALSDCNEAHRIRPDATSFLDSRGMVHLRRGEYDKAIADYDAVLRKEPKLAWSLYGRGLAKRHKGLTAEANTDIAAANAADPDLEKEVKERGLE